MAELRIGDVAPDFTLPRDGGGTIRLSDFRGRSLVVYFYPKDDTSGCTSEAKDFTALAADFDRAGAAIVGISPDPVKKHDRFVAKYDLSIPLAADEERQAIEAYGVWQEKSLYGRRYMGVERSTFLIDPEGKIARIWPKVKVKGHAEDVLAAVRELRA